jgi:hypothetical protein
MNKYIKWIAGVLGTILLGAIGSGVWDWVLSDAFSWLGNFVLTTGSSLSQTYLDSLYQDIWKGSSYSYLKEIYNLTFVIYLMLPFIMVLARKKRLETSKTNKPKKAPNKYKLAIMICAIGVMLVIKVWETTFSVKSATVLQANISIITPYISTEKALELNSLLNSVDSQKKAITLKEAINSLANENNVKIHTMEFI